MKIINPPNGPNCVSFQEADGDPYVTVYVLRGFAYTSRFPIEVYGVQTGSDDNAGRPVLHETISRFGDSSDLLVWVWSSEFGTNHQGYQRPIEGGPWESRGAGESPAPSLIERLEELALAGLAVLRPSGPWVDPKPSRRLPS